MTSERVYYLFQLLAGVATGATLTVYVPYMVEDLGFSYREVFLVNSVYFLANILTELPTGALADGRGRGWSVSMSALFLACSGVLFAIGDTVPVLIFAEFLAGTGTSFYSGAASAWIADAPDRKEQLTKVYAKSSMINTGAFMFVPILVAPLVTLHGRPFGFAFHAAGMFAAFLFARHYMQGNEPEHPLTEFEALGYAWEHLRGSASLRWITVVQLLFGLFATFNLLWSPFMLVHVSQTGLSAVWMFLYGSVVLSGLALHRFTPKSGEEGRMVLAAFMFAAVPLLLLRLSQPLGVIMALAMSHEFARGALRPLVDAFTDHRVPSAFRATLKSMTSFVGSIGFVLTNIAVMVFVGSGAPDPSTIPVIWTVSGAVLLLCITALWFSRPR